jgi:transcriptional regulator with XRE-family HTH domain
MTQIDLAASAEVSRRWLSDLEAGKATAEIGLTFKVLHALGITLEAHPAGVGGDEIDLDSLLRDPGECGAEGADRG